MSTRTVAEIIGWKPEHVFHYHDCIWCGAVDFSARERAEDCVDNPGRPTVDDMLGWLLDNGGIDEIEPWYDAEAADGGWEVHFWLTDDFDMHERAPTLHAALEAAVIAIDERNQQ